MLRVVGKINDRKFVAFGLTHADVRRLVTDTPIHAPAEELVGVGPDGEEIHVDFDVVVWSGHDEDALRRELRRYFPNLEERQGA